jgi:hypothetical protein
MGVDAAAEDDPRRRFDHHSLHRRRRARDSQLQPRAVGHRIPVPRVSQHRGHERGGRVPDHRHHTVSERPAHHLLDGERRSRGARRNRQPVLHGVERGERGHSGGGRGFSRRIGGGRGDSGGAARRHARAGPRPWDLAEQWESYSVAGGERAVLRGEEMDRFEARLGGKSGERFTGYVRLGNGLAALPVGSQLDAETGWLTWAPGAGFVGTYDLVFVRWSGPHAVARHDLRVILAPKGSRRPASTLWAPSRRTTVSPSPQRSAW